jgi:hypothetical protein
LFLSSVGRGCGHSPAFSSTCQTVTSGDKKEKGGEFAPLLLSCQILVPPRAAGRLTTEAVAAVHRAIASGLERHLGILATLGADGGVHFAAPIAAATATATVPVAAATTARALAAPSQTARRTTLRLVGVALFGVILLIFSAEGEGLAAVLAGKSPVLVAHR